VLKERGFVEIEKKGRRNVYTLYSLVSIPCASATDTEQICTEDRSDLHDVHTDLDAPNPEPDSEFEAEANEERKEGSRDSKREVQTGTSSSIRQQLKALGLRETRASALVEQFGVEKVEAGIGFVCEYEGPRSRAALLVSYLQNGGWAKLKGLKDFLLGMPDPYGEEEQAEVAWKVVEMFGSKQGAFDALEKVKEDIGRLQDSTTNEKQRKIAGSICCRASDAEYFIRKHARTRKEQQEKEELLECLSQVRAGEQPGKAVAAPVELGISEEGAECPGRSCPGVPE